MKRRFIYITAILVLVTNLATHIITKNIVVKSTSHEYKKMIAQFALYLQDTNPRKVQKMMVMSFFIELSNLTKSNILIDDYKYLCKPWNNGLNYLIQNSLLDKEDMQKNKDMQQALKRYLISATKMNKLCGNITGT